MTKEEYLQELASYLKKLPKADFEDSMAYFTELFDEAGPEGQEDLIKSLGSPQEAAREILEAIIENSSTSSLEGDKVNRGVQPSPHVFEVLSGIEKFVSISVGTQEDDHSNNLPHLLTNLPTFHTLEIDLSDQDIEISSSTDENYSIYGVSQEMIKDCHVVDGCLRLSHSFSSSNFKKLFNRFSTSSDVIVIRLPKDQNLKQLRIKQGMGDIKLCGLDLDKLHIESHLGDFNVYNLKAKQAYFNLDKGDVNLDSCSFETSQWQMKCGDLSVSRSCLIQTQLNMSLGDALFETSQLIDMVLESNLGDLDMMNCQVQGIRFRAQKGDLNGSSVLFKGDNHFRFNLGDIFLDNLEQQLDQLSLDVRTSLGDLDIRFAPREIGNFQRLILGSEDFLHIETSQGDISLE